MHACEDAPTHARTVEKQSDWGWAKITELYPEDSKKERGEAGERNNNKEGGKKKRRREEMTGV